MRSIYFANGAGLQPLTAWPMARRWNALERFLGAPRVASVLAGSEPPWRLVVGAYEHRGSLGVSDARPVTGLVFEVQHIVSTTVARVATCRGCGARLEIRADPESTDVDYQVYGHENACVRWARTEDVDELVSVSQTSSPIDVKPIRFAPVLPHGGKLLRLAWASVDPSRIEPVGDGVFSMRSSARGEHTGIVAAFFG